MRGTFSTLLILSMLLTFGVLVSRASGKIATASLKSAKRRFSGNWNYGYEDHEVNLSFDPNWFFDNPSEFNPELCTLSSFVSLLAYDKSFDKPYDYVTLFENGEKILDCKATEASDYFNTLGFHDVKFINLSDESDKTRISTARFVIGRQKLTYREKTITLILVSVRGSIDTGEWISNVDFRPDEKKNHAGFDKAAERTEEEIQKYLREQKIDGEIVFWLTGHSRGAAVSNIIGADFSENAKCFVYTFASPNTTVKGERTASKHTNVFNIVNEKDIVPKVPQFMGNFRKYGVTKTGTADSGHHCHDVIGYYIISQHYEEITVVLEPIECSKKYKEPDPDSFDYELTCKNDASELIEGALSRKAGENAGEYEITVGDVHCNNAEYDFVFKTGRFFTIAKADAPKAVSTSESFAYKKGSAGEKSFEVYSLLPDDCGDITETVDVEGDNLFENIPEIKDGKLFFNVKPRAKFDKQSCTVSVNLSTQNYEDVTFEYKIKLKRFSAFEIAIAIAAASVITAGILIALILLL